MFRILRRRKNREAEGRLPAPAPPPAPVGIDLSTAIAQSQSPLFGTIPPEIRNYIFSLVFQGYVDPERMWDRETYFTRPGFEGESRIDVALLRTCKAIWAETRGMPDRAATLTYYFGNANRAPTASWDQRWETKAPRQTRNLYNKHRNAESPLQNRVQVFSQMCAIEPGFRDMIFGLYQVKPKEITLTFRYTDWWYWEDNMRIYPIEGTKFFNMQAVELPSSVEKMVVEFENIEKNRSQLEGVIDELFADRDRWVWKRENGTRMLIKGESQKDSVKEWSWLGPTKFRGMSFDHHGEGDSMKMIVKVVEWVAEKPTQA